MAEELLKEVQNGLAELFNDNHNTKKGDDGPSRHTASTSDNSHPYSKVSKSSAILATREFYDQSFVQDNPQECVRTLTTLLYLQNSRDDENRLGRAEATEVFFAATMLFVSSDWSVKRMVYLFIKEVCRLVDPSDVIIVTSCLTKDMTCGVELYRSRALRVLVRIIDSAMLGALERYVKQALVDTNAAVSSSALVSSLHFFRQSSDGASVVRRWVREISEAMENPCPMVQLHATQLLYEIKANDRLAVSKFLQIYCPVESSPHSSNSQKDSVSQSSNRHTSTTTQRNSKQGSQTTKRMPIRSPLALLCLLRYAARLLHDEINSGRANTSSHPIKTASQLCTICYKILESNLRHSSDMVVYEAARSICYLPSARPEDVTPALKALHVLLASPRPSARMGAVKTLHHLATTFPGLVATVNDDLEGLLGDPNRLVGTLSVVTLLKTGNEQSIDRLLRSIATFLSFIADEYKVIVVYGLAGVCLSFPQKHTAVVGFLAKFLRDEGGFRFKTTIVDTMLSLMNQVPETREASLLHLCEFIEDCEYVRLITQILHIVGSIGPQTDSPARYVRFVYNRVILECAMVRAAAVTVLGRFGAACPFLRGSIVTLLKRSLGDEDDEVRDRAVVALMVLEVAEKECPYVEPMTDEEEEEEEEKKKEKEESSAEFLLLGNLPFSFGNLQKRLELYRTDSEAMERPETLSFDVLPVVEDNEYDTTTQSTLEPMNQLGYETVPPLPSFTTDNQDNGKKLDPSTILYAVPEFASFGRVFRSSTSIPLTETEAEYVVHCTKHVYNEHVVLQFIVENTIEDQQLSNVSVAVDSADETLFEATGEIPADTIAYGTSASCFTVLTRNTEVPVSSATFVCELKFMVTRINADTEETEGDDDPIEEEYALEDLEIKISDFVSPSSIIVGDFKRSWTAAAGEGEVLQKFSLKQNNLQDASRILIECLGMQVCDGTGRVRSGAKQHMMHLCGTVLGGVDVFARAQVTLGSSNNTVLKIAVRSKSESVSKMVIESIS